MGNKQNQPTEYKTFPFKLTSLDTEGRTLEGYASTFGNQDSVGDIVFKGAFRKTLEQRGDRVKFLWQHDPKEPIGRPIEMREDDNGLFVKAIISDTSRGRDSLALLRDSAIDELSIGYDAIKGGTEYTKDDDGNEVRLLKELRLYEFSLVTFAANSEAQVTGLKEHGQPSESKPAPDITENTIRIRVRDPGDFNPNAFGNGEKFRTIDMGDEDSGIQAVIGKLKGETDTSVQSYIFDKEKFTVAQAQAWVDEHKKDAVPEDWEEKVVTESDAGAVVPTEQAQDTYQCECIECGYTMESDQHCREVECPECGGKMRRAERPGPGKSDEGEEEQEKADDTQPDMKEGPPEAVVFASVVLQDTLTKLGADTWEYKAAELALSKLRNLYGDEVDATELEAKAGRVLAARNAQRIGQALGALISVLEDAGIDVPGVGKKPESEEEEEPKDYSLEIETLEAELGLIELE